MATPAPDTADVLAAGLAAIRAAAGVAGPFAPEAVAEAEAAQADLSGRRDRTGLPFVTLDPASSTDLDQAFALERDGDAIVLHYAIADIGAFVARGSAVEAEAFRRGTSVYAPDGTVPLYPPLLSSGKASLLPDGPRPAIVLTVAVAPDGNAVLRDVERCVVRSRAKLAYERVGPAELPEPLTELCARIEAAEERRGAFRVELPEQEIEHDPGAPCGIRLRFVPLLRSEEMNAALSLAANLAVAASMQQHGLGLYRVMDDPDGRELASLHRSARTLGIRWPDGEGLRRLVPRLDASDPAHAAFVALARRAAGGATYAVLTPPQRPWHAAMAAPYAHATAPMRRLADRYVLELLLAQHAGASPDRGVLDALPDVMERAETTAARVDRESLDLAECVMLRDRIGDTFDATVVEVDQQGVVIQIADPAVRSRAKIGAAEPGRQVRVRLASVDLATRRQVWQPV